MLALCLARMIRYWFISNVEDIDEIYKRDNAKKEVD